MITGALVVTGCGKRGAPLPPLQRIPAPPPDLNVTRIADDVYARFTVPSLNVDGVGPADVGRVELYALTAERPPQISDPKQLRALSTLVATEPIRRPLPPPPPVEEGRPPVPFPPPGPGVDQGAVIVVREPLTPAMQTPVTLPRSDKERATVVEPPDLPRVLVAPPDDGGPQRFYFAVAVSPRGRYGPHSGLVPTPLGPTSSAPPRPEIAVDEKSMTIRWKPPVDARGVVEETPPDLLPSKPLVAGPPPTTYDVYELPRNETPERPELTVPVPVTPAPVGALEFTQADISLGTERCFVVRPVDILSGIHVRGPGSPSVCASFADTFAPSPPGKLVAVATAGMISLIWDPSEAPDLAGYLVLRGDAGSATLAPLIPELVSATTYRDASVRPDNRYVYAVVAVDKAGNRSTESNHVEETARAPNF